MAFAAFMRIVELDENIHKGMTPLAPIALNHLWESSSQGPSTILPRHMPSTPGSTTIIEATRSPSDPIMDIPFSRITFSFHKSSNVPLRLSLRRPSGSLLLKSTNTLNVDIHGLCSLSTTGTGLDTEGENKRLAASGSSPTTVACVGDTPRVEMTSPPAALTCPTVVTPTWLCVMLLHGWQNEAPFALSAEKPNGPAGWGPVPFAIPATEFAPCAEPPRTTSELFANRASVVASPPAA